MRRQISAVIVAYNEEKNLPRCLKSIQWANEIIVVDSFSRDRTVEVAQSFGAKTFQHTYQSYTRQIAFAVDQSRLEWIFLIDADEEVSPALKEEILHILDRDDEPFKGYDVPRRIFFLGRWINHGEWYPDYQFRLFRRDFVYINHQEVHGAFSGYGEIGKLKSDLYHFTYPTLFDYINTINKYTSLQVSTKLEEGWKKQVRWYDFILHPLSYFLRMFIVHKGYKDGLHGLILALFSSFYNLALYAKLWEYQCCKDRGDDLPPITNDDFQKRKLR